MLPRKGEPRGLARKGLIYSAWKGGGNWTKGNGGFHQAAKARRFFLAEGTAWAKTGRYGNVWFGKDKQSDVTGVSVTYSRRKRQVMRGKT